MRRFWLIPIILIPFIAMLAVQYRSLRSLEMTTASAERNWLRSSIDDVVRDTEHYYRHAAKTTLNLTPSTLECPPSIFWWFHTHTIDGAKTYFAINFNDNAPWYTFDGATRAPKIVGSSEEQAIKLAIVSWLVLHKMQTIVATPALSVEERDPENRVIVRPVVNDALHVVGVAGVVLDQRLAQQKVLPALAMKTVGRRFTRADDADFRFGDPDSNQFATEGLRFVFTDWKVGLRDRAGRPEDIAAIDFRINALWSLGVAIVLFGAIALAGKAAAREMRLSQMKSDFVSNVSHELRTPLSSIRVFGEYMRLGRVTTSEKMREYGEYIETESRRLTQLINNILDFSKIESAEKKYRFAAADLGCVVAETVAAFEMPLREKGVSIALHPAEAPMPVTIDRDAIGQAIVNLLDNAVKYSNGSKEIAVTLSSGDGESRVAIEDHGIGIAPRDQKKIFDKFYRVGSGLVHDVKGSGLGLAIVQHVVKAHGGRVEVSSEPGRGSTFTIVLPRTLMEAA
jgi:signal transduction histidine kinase